MTWERLFERGETYDVTVEEIAETLSDHRTQHDE